jgi:DNA-binding PadR family transcriptional regulator
VQKLTTTSYLILGHLALRDWSTYELAQQLKRSTRHYWPRAESKIYEEPKKLVAHGLATATREHTGRRPRTVYAITENGREALRRWLQEPPQPPLVEFDGIVKVLFAATR